jgi:DNA repair exonuclease SbcCD ATPase subunit
MDELIAKIGRLKEIESELAQIAENRKAVRALEDGYRKERGEVIAALRKLGISIARERTKKVEKKSKKKAEPTI